MKKNLLQWLGIGITKLKLIFILLSNIQLSIPNDNSVSIPWPQNKCRQCDNSYWVLKLAKCLIVDFTKSSILQMLQLSNYYKSFFWKWLQNLFIMLITEKWTTEILEKSSLCDNIKSQLFWNRSCLSLGFWIII